MRVLLACLRRDLLVQRSYRAQLVGQVLGTGFMLASLAFLSRIVPGGQPALAPYGGDYFTFVLVGNALIGFFATGLSSFSDAIGQEQAAGTLESLLVTPNDSRLLLVGGSLWPFCFSALQAAVLLGLGFLFFGAQVTLANLGLVALLTITCLATFSALGLVVAAFLVRTKRSALLVGGLTAGFTLAGGVFYPVSVLPEWLQVVARALPMSYGLDGVRRALLPAPDLNAIGLDVAVLLAYALLLLPAATIIFGWSVNRSRRDGTLGHY